ncbi:hypothetical protein SBV1_2300042 [Verrucomicrobia bacterium]|nr:hypothetical protein SBV1_2300042 [Verrucomicrobiota bacterium]
MNRVERIRALTPTLSPSEGAREEWLALYGPHPSLSLREREKRFARLENSDTAWVITSAALAGRTVR